MVCYQFERRETEADRHPSPSPQMGTANDPPPLHPFSPPPIALPYPFSPSSLVLCGGLEGQGERKAKMCRPNEIIKSNLSERQGGRTSRFVLCCDRKLIVSCAVWGKEAGGGRPIMGYCLKGRRYSTDPSTPFCTYPHPTHPTAGTRDKLHEKDSKARKEIQAVTSPPKPPASKAA